MIRKLLLNNDKIVVNCRTKKSIIHLKSILCDFHYYYIFHDINMDPLFNVSSWYKYKEKTCFNIFKDWNGKYCIRLNDKDYFKGYKCEIIDFNIYRAKHIAKQYLDNV